MSPILKAKIAVVSQVLIDVAHGTHNIDLFNELIDSLRDLKRQSEQENVTYKFG